MISSIFDSQKIMQEAFLLKINMISTIAEHVSFGVNQQYASIVKHVSIFGIYATFVAFIYCNQLLTCSVNQPGINNTYSLDKWIWIFKSSNSISIAAVMKTCHFADSYCHLLFSSTHSQHYGLLRRPDPKYNNLSLINCALNQNS